MPKDEQERLVERIAGSLSQVSRQDIVDRAIGHFLTADEEYGSRVEESVRKARKS